MTTERMVYPERGKKGSTMGLSVVEMKEESVVELETE